MRINKIIGLLFLIAGFHVGHAKVITNSANINMTDGSNLILNGTNIENNNIITASPNSKIILKGTQSIKVSGSNSLSFGTVKLENGQGVILFNPMNIQTNMIFDNGVLSAQNGSYVLFENGATSTVNSDSSYVDGIVKKVGISSFTFNVGANSIGRGLSVSEMSGIDTVSVEYFKTAPSDSGYNTSLTGDSLQLVSQCEYWTVNGKTSANARVTLSWNGIESCGVGNINDLRVSNWNGAQWENDGAYNVTGNTSNGTISTSSAPSLLGTSIFTLGSISINNPLPIELGYFLARLENEGTVRLDWSTLSEVNSDYFIIEESNDGVNFIELDRIDAAGTSNRELSYVIYDDYLDNVNHYALYLINLDGEREHLSEALLVNENFEKTNFKIGNNFIEMPQSRVSSTVRFTLYDLKGSMILDEVYGLGANIDFLEIIPPIDLKGIYIGKLSCGDQLISQKLQFIK